jgi:hypothetical protein
MQDMIMLKDKEKKMKKKLRKTKQRKKSQQFQNASECSAAH